MPVTPVSEFEQTIRTYWHCEGRDRHVGPDLLAYLRNPLAKLGESEFRRLLARAIVSQQFSTEQYEALTGIDFNAREEVAHDLQDFWSVAFKGEPLPK
jgi:hypothetical protein